MTNPKALILASFTILSLISGCQANHQDSIKNMIMATETIAPEPIKMELPSATETTSISPPPATSPPVVAKEPIRPLTPLAPEYEVQPKSGEQLGYFLTKFNTKNKARTNNITLASKQIDEITLKPNEIFSYNETIGPAGKESGYKLAKIFVKGKEKEGYGGGICQVSSTLFNAAKVAGMEIVERHAHTGTVSYVEKDQDAATSYGSIDFKFKNTRSYPIKIASKIEDGTLTVSLITA